MTRYLTVVLVGLFAAAVGAGEDLPAGQVVGALVADSGQTVVGVTPADSWDSMTVLSLSGQGKGAVQSLDIAGKSMSALLDGRFLMYGHRIVDGRGGLAYRVYRVKDNGKVELEKEFSSHDLLAWREEAWVRVSADHEVWVAMANLYRGVKAATAGRHFAFGDLESGRIRSKVPLSFYTAPERLDDTAAFEILQSDGPTVLASYAGDLFVIRFGDGGVQTRPVEHLRHVVRSRGGSLNVVWQYGERVLWARKGGEWLAYDSWNIGYGLEFPEEPFVRRSAAHGSPHPIRGFVEIERDGSRYRVKHSWRSPQFEDWREEHVSDWRDGPVPAAVSPNGRHALVLESRSTEEGGSVVHARRFGLEFLAAAPPVETAPAGVEGQKDGHTEPGQ